MAEKKLTEHEKEIGKQVYAWECNMFAAPRGYFQSKSAKELGISEEARDILIKKHAEYWQRADAAREKKAADGRDRRP